MAKVNFYVVEYVFLLFHSIPFSNLFNKMFSTKTMPWNFSCFSLPFLYFISLMYLEFIYIQRVPKMHIHILS